MDRRSFLKGSILVPTLLPIYNTPSILDEDGITWRKVEDKDAYQGIIRLYGRVQMESETLHLENERIVAKELDDQLRRLRYEFMDMYNKWPR
jgi:hypothetical protein